MAAPNTARGVTRRDAEPLSGPARDALVTALSHGDTCGAAPVTTRAPALRRTRHNLAAGRGPSNDKDGDEVSNFVQCVAPSNFSLFSFSRFPARPHTHIRDEMRRHQGATWRYASADSMPFNSGVES